MSHPFDAHAGDPALAAADTAPDRAKPFVLPRIEGMNELIVFLALAAQFFFGIPALKGAQSGAEIMLLVVLVYGCLTIRFGLQELGLIALLVVMSVVSMAMNSVDVVLVGMKQFGLAILTLIYFSRVRFRSRLILPTFIVTVLLMVVARLAPPVVEPLIRISRAPEFNESRFGGLFLNTHYNAYFLAVALIYYGYRVPLAGLGQLVVFVTGSKFVFVSYAANVAARFRLFQILVRYRRLLFFLVVAGAWVVWTRRADIVGRLSRTEMISLYVIVSQLFDPHFYRLVLNPFPGDYLAIVNGLQGNYGTATYTNEIGLFAMSVQGGVFLAAAYLASLLKHTPYYRVFIVVSLFHYGFVLSPLIVYMLVTYSREIALAHESATPAPELASAPASEPTSEATFETTSAAPVPDAS